MVTYGGDATRPGDAWKVFAKYRRGEPLFDGPYIGRFEGWLSRYHGGREVITFGAGRMALYAILKAMGLHADDEVILPGYTCIVTPSAICFAGQRPVYADVSFRNFNMIPERVEEAVTPRTKAILAQHTFGIPCDMEALLDISTRTGIPIIEDGAHAIGGRWRGELLGNLGYAAFFSTQATKMLSTERGGYAVTKDKTLGARIRDLQQRAEYAPPSVERSSVLRWCYRAAFTARPWLNPRASFVRFGLGALRFRGLHRILDYDREEYETALAGRRFEPYPSPLGNLLAYAGLLQLDRLEQDLRHRRRLASLLDAELPRLGAEVAAVDRDQAEPSWVRFPFHVEDRDRWVRVMRKSGLAAGFWLDDPIHPAQSDWRAAGYARGSCPNAEHLSKRILNVPVDSRVSPARLRRWLRRCATM